MHIVYVLVSLKDPKRHYVGITQNLEDRLRTHNSDGVGYAKHYAPWRVGTYVAFDNKMLAIKFEKYLKSGSGHAFLNRHLIH
jgi:predicted GIY-YIG superfamily endonuclease